MASNEKINIYIPAETKQQLYNDAMLFEVLKKDRIRVNMNRFLSLVLCGFYDKYVEEQEWAKTTILEILSSSSLSEREAERITDQLAAEVFSLPISKRKGKKAEHISFKPTVATEGIISDIQSRLHIMDYVSQYLCRLLVSYCEKPMSVRERILFSDRIETIQAAICKRFISFSLIWDETKRHEVIPYEISCGHEEMYNYLICVEKNLTTGQPEIRSYRLSRITDIHLGVLAPAIDEKYQLFCEQTIKIAPQYAINTDTVICVRLSADGVKLYNRIYFGRPPYERIEKLPDGEDYHYYFRCSPDQVFHYFRRFDNSTAIIISPLPERERMFHFHKNALEAYLLPELESDGGCDYESN